MDETGFHWHARRFDQAPVRVYRYYTDPGQGDVLDIRIDSDVLAKPGRVDVRGRDPKQRKTINAAGSDAETKRDTLGDLIEVVDPETGRTVLERRNATASVHASAAAGAGPRQARGRCALNLVAGVGEASRCAPLATRRRAPSASSRSRASARCSRASTT